MEQRLGIDSSAGLEQLRADRVCSQPLGFQRVFLEKQLVPGSCAVVLQLLVTFGIKGSGSLSQLCLAWYQTQRDGNMGDFTPTLDRNCSEAMMALLGNDS